jgi:hypothetical protein
MWRITRRVARTVMVVLRSGWWDSTVATRNSVLRLRLATRNEKRPAEFVTAGAPIVVKASVYGYGLACSTTARPAASKPLIAPLRMNVEPTVSWRDLGISILALPLVLNEWSLPGSTTPVLVTPTTR